MKRSINKIILLFIVSILLTINSVARPAYPAEAFAFTVKTDNNGSSSDLQFDIPTHPTYSSDYNYNVDCEGDGTYEHTGITGDFTCNYTNKGTYTIAIGGIFPAIYFHNEGDKEKITSVSQWGTQEWKTMGSAFSGASNLVVHAYDNPDLSNVNNMNSMFYNATALTFTFSIDDWDVSFVEDMSMMFTGATVFNNNISSWDVSSVTTMNGMFYDATAFNQDIENWDTSKVLYLSSMFLRAENFNQDIGDWDVS
ncbi:MAG: BspA family leucine-rich repeat surface protein, partial [Campylobacterota bacterium]|nr:BspA family leucine-rich repeat surface protein [Campylobacterota bacterium]